MSTGLDMSLDDIISKNKRSGGQRGSSRGRGSSSTSGPGPSRRLSSRSLPRAVPYTTLPPMPMQGQMWQHQVLSSVGSSADTVTKLYISNLDYGVSNEDIKVLFSEVGELKQYSIHYDKSGRSKGTAEVVFLHQTDAIAAVTRYNNVQLDGKPMKIELVGPSLVIPAAVPPSAKGVLGNPFGAFRSMQGRVGSREQFRGVREPFHGGREPFRGGREPFRGGGGSSSSSRGIGGGRGQGKGHAEKISVENLNADLEKYHSEAMQIS